MGAKNRISLSIKDSFRVIQWLVKQNESGEFVRGAKAEEIAKACGEELEIPHLNRDHIINRLKEMDITLRPRAPKDQTAKNAEDIRNLATALYQLYSQLGVNASSDLAKLFIDSQ